MREYSVDVIPAKAGIHLDLDFTSEEQRAKAKWIPASAGMTTTEDQPGA
jgi:hypothetical protein